MTQLLLIFLLLIPSPAASRRPLPAGEVQRLPLPAGEVGPAQPDRVRVVEISAKKFEFTPNHITLKRGEPVTLRVSAIDRDHGLLQQDLGIDLDLEPERVAEITITPQTAGHFTAICDDFCGSGHGNMKLAIDVE